MVILSKNTLRMHIVAILLAGSVFSSTVEAEVSLAQEYFERAVDFHFSGENEKAIRAFKQSLRYNNKDATTHFYLSLIYDVVHMGANAITQMLKAEKYFEMEERSYWKNRSRQRLEEYYAIYKLRKEDFKK
jgi:hypothetical protein